VRTRVWGAVMDELRAAAPRTRREHADGAEPGSRPQLTSLEALEADEAAGRGRIDLSTPAAEPAEVERQVAVRRALEIFPHTERQVLVGHFVEGRPASELAQALGVSEQQIRRTRERAVLRLRRALAARHHAARGATRGNARRPGDSPLTARELDVLRWAARGASARETAARLGRGEQTIASQRKRVIGKLGARNMAHAIAIAFGLELLP
jgi:RNA polymerase sigma factor (sigma-70 family)